MPRAAGAPSGPPGRGGRWFGRVVLAIGLLAFLLPVLSPGPDADVWWHLRAGADFLAGRSGMFVESWSFTAAGTPWVNHEWLAEALFALGNRVGGEAGVITLAALLVLGTGLLVARTALREKVPFPVVGALLAVAPLVLGDRLVPRPHLFSFFFLALTLERFGAARRGDASWWWLPAVQLAWTNSHGPVVGLGVMTLLLLGGGAEWRKRLPVLGAVVLASLVHPSGFRALTDYLGHFGEGGLYRQMVQEWQPLLDPTQARLPGRWPTLVLVAGTLVALSIALFRGRRANRWGLAVLLAGLCAGPFLASRNRDFLAIAALPVLALLSGPWSSPAKGWRGGIRASGALVTVAALLLAAVGAFGMPPAWPIRFRLDRSMVPDEATNFLARVPGAGGHLFATYDFGGWIVHALPPDWKVFVDGRYFVYGEPLVREYLETRDAAPGSRERLKARDADWLLVRYPAADGYAALAGEARRWPEWALVHWDDRALVYVRRDRVEAGWLDAHDYRTVDPTLTVMPDDEAWWRDHVRQIVPEAWRAVREAPASAKPRILLSLALERAGRDGDAARFYREVADLFPGHRVAIAAVNRIGQRHGRTLPPPTPDDLFRNEFGLEP